MVFNMAGGAKEPKWTYTNVRLTPIMTNTTIPRGEASASSFYKSSSYSYYGWRAFGNVQGWALVPGGWVQYLFPAIFSKVRVKRLELHQNANYPKEFYSAIEIQIIDEDNTVTTVASLADLTEEDWTNGVIVELNHECRGIRITTSATGGTPRGGIGRSVIYGDVKVACAIDEDTLNSGS